MNISLATNLVSELVRQGVGHFVVCAGARNAPLVKVLHGWNGIEVMDTFEERAAGFFALGKIKSHGQPVAVVTTSGTAVAELMPAAIEAYYSGLALILITADRPKDYRGSGAPQAIEQVGIFGPYASPIYDIDEVEQTSQIIISVERPTHINVCFNEPLLDNEIEKLSISKGQSSLTASVDKNPLMILGGLSEKNRSAVAEALSLWKRPIYIESISGLRGNKKLAELQLNSFISQLEAKNFKTYFDSIIRIGSVPSLRIWRDLEDTLKDVPVLSFAECDFSGLGRENHRAGSLQDFLSLSVTEHQQTQLKPDHKFDLQELNRQKKELLNRTLLQHPLSEPGWFRWLSQKIAIDAKVFLGNSLPIREWDLAEDDQFSHANICANRGANGIDGLIASFLGWSSSESDNWLILGDLSALYDLNSLVLSPLAQGKNIRIIVINNRGGQIFKPMFKDPAFINAHAYEFSHWAKMFGFGYSLWTDQNVDLSLQDRHIIEIRPDENETTRFWQTLRRNTF